MKYWLHRISHEANISYPLLDNGYLSIGFSDFCEEEFLRKTTLEGNWSYFEKYINDAWPNNPYPRTRFNLWRFLVEMKKGDWVIVPSWGTFSIYEMIDEAPILASDNSIILPKTDWSGKPLYRDSNTNLIKIDGNDSFVDIGFLRVVAPIEKDIPREKFADAAFTSRMKIRGTNADISDLEKSIQKALDSFRINRPINLKAELVDQSVNGWAQLITKKLTPAKFEKLVKWYFEKVGASTVYIKSKNYEGKKGDVDVVATFESIRTIINVQAKHYEGITSEWPVEQIKEFQEEGKISNTAEGYSEQYWVISSSDSFSQECINLAKAYGVILIDGKQFSKMIMNVGIEGLEFIGNK